mgnify:CR=1 FL=1
MQTENWQSEHCEQRYFSKVTGVGEYESGKFYKGLRPKNKRVPFNIDIRVGKGEEILFGAFDGLD